MLLVNKPQAVSPAATYNAPDETVSAHLYMLRAVAALVVLVGHTREGLFAPLEKTSPPSVFNRVTYEALELGHQAVMVFFVLSGYLITLSIAKAIRKNSWGWKTYLVARLSRLWVVLIPALLLGWFWDSLGIQLFGLTGVYGSTNMFSDDSTGITTVIERLNLPTGIGNAFFVQRILVPTFGSNDAIWSLGNEFWYYILFPLLLLAIVPQTGLAKRILYGLAAVGVLYFIGLQIALYFLVWLMGASLVILPPVQKLLDTAWKRRTGLVVAFAGIVSSIVLTHTRLGARVPVLLDFLLGLFVALLIYVLLHSRPARPADPAGFYNKTAERLANFSYTLYLVHLPLLAFIREAFIPRERLDYTPANLALAGAIDIVIMLYAFGVSRLTEAHTDKVRSYIMRKIF